MELIDSKKLQALILTKDEAPNIGRVLERLSLLESVIVLDSYSTDDTVAIAEGFPNVRAYRREFDTHATQWNYGLSLLAGEWVLSLDADYVLTDDFISEVKEKLGTGDKAAYLTEFKFVVFGEGLRGDNTTPRPVLFRRSNCSYYDDGHTQRLQIDGPTGEFDAYILHDDRKSLSRWISNQGQYSVRECVKLASRESGPLSLTARLRRTKILAPISVFLYCLFGRGLIFNGWRGWHYTLQRTMVEMLLALRLIEATKLSVRADLQDQ
jgi:glycosyltransferase involved in cell wall biosynthesis